MKRTVELGTTFFSRSHYISQSQEILDFIPDFTRDAVIIFDRQRYAGRISWSFDGKVKGLKLPQAEFIKFEKANPTIKKGTNSLIELNIELNTLSYNYMLNSDDELIENVRLPLRPGMSEDEFYRIQEKMKIVGRRGEESIVLYEKSNLTNNGRADLAERVERVSAGDIGLGYDILSFDAEGNKKYIEVKTTTTNNNSFEFTINEKKICSKLREKYSIYFIKNYKLELDIAQVLDLNIISGLEFESKITLKPSCYTAQLI